MTTYRFRLIGLAASLLAAAALACNALTPGATPTVPAPVTSTPVPVVATATTVPTDVPATEVPPTDVPATAVPATEAPNVAIRLVIGKTDGTAFLVDAQGQVTPITEMQEPLYIYTHALSADLGAPGQAYNISSAGIFPLAVVQNVFQGFAAYVGPAAPNGLLAWDSYSVDPNGQGLIGQIHLSSPDGADQRVAYEETSTISVLKVWRWAADGQHLYFSKEPLGLGGYIPFDGITNIWELTVADGSVREVVPSQGLGIICIDDLAADESLVAHHCNLPMAEVDRLGQGPVAVVAVPPEAAGAALVGDVRLSPDASRVAFAAALGSPDGEQGWAAVSDGLSGTAHLVATANPGEVMQVVQWLDADTVLLQSIGQNPGVYRAAADGSGAQRLADGTLLGVIDNVAGQP